MQSILKSQLIRMAHFTDPTKERLGIHSQFGLVHGRAHIMRSIATEVSCFVAIVYFPKPFNYILLDFFPVYICNTLNVSWMFYYIAVMI